MEYDLIKRLSQYKKILLKLKSMGFVKVFSDNLSDALGISASLVRKDFAACNLTGRRRGGYQVNELIDKLNILLGKNGEQRVIIVGCGKLGSALMNYKGFETEQIKIIAGFDTNPGRQNPEALIPVLPAEQMESFVRSQRILVAILTVPEDASLHTMERLQSYGIRGILNFAQVPIRSSESCNVENVNLALEVEKLFYFINAQQSRLPLKEKAS
jgi:redox-sensing transcriptional repressor